MQVISNFPFYINKTTASTEQDIIPVTNSKADALAVEVSGNATFEIAIEGKTNPNDDNWFALSCVKINGLKVVDAIVEPGIYTADITGSQEIRANIKSISGGSVSVFGRMISEG